MNEIWLETSYTSHDLNSSTYTSRPNRTCCTLPNMPFHQLMPFMWLHVWFIPLYLTVPMIPQPYGIWFFSSKCRRTSSQREGWVLALQAAEAEIKDAWSSTHPPWSWYSLSDSPQDISAAGAYVDVLHTPYRSTHASCKRELNGHKLARQRIPFRLQGLCLGEKLWGAHTCLFLNLKC